MKRIHSFLSRHPETQANLKITGFLFVLLVPTAIVYYILPVLFGFSIAQASVIATIFALTHFWFIFTSKIAKKRN